MALIPGTKVGFLGAGNLCQAIAGGLIDSGVVKPENIMASARTEAGLEKVQQMGIAGTLDNKKVVSECSVVFLSVVPKVLPHVLKEVSNCVTEDHLLISVVCSTTNKQIEDMIGKKVSLIRAIPNTPVAVRSGVTRGYPGTHCTPEQVNLCRVLMEPLGIFSILPTEALINSTSGLCGCSPAFVFMMIDSMADAAVRMGLPREQAVKLAAKTVEGSARMVLESDKHVSQLVNDVCTPGGTTIEGVFALERAGFKGTVMDAVIISTEKSLQKMEKK